MNSVQTSKTRGGDSVPEIQRLLVADLEEFTPGALVVLNSDGEVEECSADPSSVTGVALQGAFTGPGHNVANDNEVVARTGVDNEASIALATRAARFHARGMSTAGTVAVAPLQTHIGEMYGMLRLANGDWVIDFDDTTNAIIQITDVFPELNPGRFEFKFLDAVLTLP